MKILATIESVEITRKVQHSDGTWGNVYGITLASGDDRILADRNLTNDKAEPATEAAQAVPAEPAQEAAKEAQMNGDGMPF